MDLNQLLQILTTRLIYSYGERIRKRWPDYINLVQRHGRRGTVARLALYSSDRDPRPIRDLLDLKVREPVTAVWANPAKDSDGDGVLG